MFSTFTGRAAKMTDAGVLAAAQMIGVGRDELLSVIEVETGGRGFQRDGKLKMLFEPHLFYAALRLKPALLTRAIQGGVAYKKYGEKPYPSDSYARLTFALSIDETAALECASWGLPQIIGSNFALAGATSVQNMLLKFVDSEDAQLVALADFLKSAGLVAALKAHNWAAVARGYNGSSYRTNRYDDKLRDAYAKLSAAKPVGFMTAGDGAVAPADDAHVMAAALAPVAPALSVPAPAVYATQTDEGAAVTVPNPTTDPVAASAATIEPATPPADALPETLEQPTPPPGPKTETVLFVQQQLVALGYHFVGDADGSPDDWTEAAILDFRNSYNKAFPSATPLPLVPTIDDALLLALPKGPRKAVSVARATATAATLAPDHPGIVEAGRAKLTAVVLGAPAAIAAFFSGIVNNIAPAQDYLVPVRSLVSDVPGWVWAVGVFAAATIIYITAHRSEARQIDNVKTGKTA